MIGHDPLAIDGQCTSFNFEPVSTLHVSNSAIISGEREELLPQLQTGDVGPQILFGVRQDTQSRGMAYNEHASMYNIGENKTLKKFLIFSRENNSRFVCPSIGPFICLKSNLITD